MVTMTAKEPVANIDKFGSLVTNVLSARQDTLRRLFDPKRDLYKDCGYEETEDISVEDLLHSFERNPLANRVVRVFAEESWKVLPDVYESENPEEMTTFEKAFDELGKNFQDRTYYQAQEPCEGNPIWKYLAQGDTLSGIGEYGGVLLGFDDSVDMRLQVRRKQGRKLLFMRPLDQTALTVSNVDNNPKSRRYGMPREYLVTLGTSQDGMNSKTGTQISVHWSRVLHLADNVVSNPWIGIPRQVPVWNPLKDYDKVRGGSAEMYWRGAFPGLSIETHPQLGGDVEIDEVAVKETMKNYMNKLQRYLALTGMTAKSLAPQVSDPTAQLNAQVEACSIQLDCPKRILIGSERGELASTQDDKKWNDKITARQVGHVTPNIVVPFIDRMIWAGVLPEPKSFGVIWPDLDSTTDAERAEIAVNRTHALGQYVQDDIERVIPLPQFLTTILKLPKREVLAVVSAATKLKGSKDRFTMSGEDNQKASARSEASKISSLKKQEKNPATKVKAKTQRGRLKSQQPRDLNK